MMLALFIGLVLKETFDAVRERFSINYKTITEIFFPL